MSVLSAYPNHRRSIENFTDDEANAAYRPHAEDDDFVQPRALWEKVLGDTDRDHMVHNIVAHAGDPAVTDDMKKRVVEYWRNVHKDLGDRVAKAWA